MWIYLSHSEHAVGLSLPRLDKCNCIHHSQIWCKNTQLHRQPMWHYCFKSRNLVGHQAVKSTPWSPRTLLSLQKSPPPPLTTAWHAWLGTEFQPSEHFNTGSGVAWQDPSHSATAALLIGQTSACNPTMHPSTPVSKQTVRSTMHLPFQWQARSGHRLPQEPHLAHQL